MTPRRPHKEEKLDKRMLTLTLVMAILANTEEGSQKAVELAASIVWRMQPLDVARCQRLAKRIINTNCKGD